VNANGKLARDPLFEVGDERFREVMPMPGSTLLEPVIQTASRYSRDGDRIAAEIVKVVGNKYEAILISARRRVPIGPTRIPPRGKIDS
jgi:hypothetical protein